MTAIAVLIITCPCALGLAVPAVQAVASGVLFRNGVMIKDGAALEKLSGVDTVIFDKTGTLTLGRPRLVNGASITAASLAIAAGLARSSRHPLSRAVCEAAKARGIAPAIVEDIQEIPGRGLSGLFQGGPVRLGSRKWCGIDENDGQGLPEFVLMRNSRAASIFTFEDELRGDAAAVIAKLKDDGLRVEILSGDREAAVRRAAVALGIERWQAGVTPQQKLAYVEQLKEAGWKVLMVGDGLNDAPALAAGLTSMAPSSATDIGRTAADSIFMGESLLPVLVAREVAIATQRLSLQNFALAVGYNVFAVPIAMLGFASPLVAAVAMSTSSIIVIANSLRLGLIFRQRPASAKVQQPDVPDLAHLERRAA
jgi:Cu2+-exporting ATPase